MQNFDPSQQPKTNPDSEKSANPFNELNASFRRETGLFNVDAKVDPSCHTAIKYVPTDRLAHEEVFAVAHRFGINPTQISEIDIHRFNSRGWHIETADQDYYLKKNIGWKLKDNGELLRALDQVFMMLFQEGISAPHIYSNTETPDPFVRHGRHTFMLFDKIEATHRLQGSEWEVRAFAREVADMHTALRSFEQKQPQALIFRQVEQGYLGQGYNELVPENKLQQLIEYAIAASDLDPLKQTVLDSSKSILDGAKLVSRLIGQSSNAIKESMQLIHADLLAQNILVSDHGITIVDFEKMHRGPVYADIATGAFESARQAGRFHGIDAVKPMRNLFLDTYFELNSQTPRNEALIAGLAINRALQQIQVDLERHFVRDDRALDALIKPHLAALEETKYIFDIA